MTISAVDSYGKLQLLNAKNINFRSENISNLAIKQDTVEISPENKKKKKGLSTGMKLLLGVGGTGVALYGALVTHRAISRPSLNALQKEFTEIFRRDVPAEEIPEMLKKYKEILKIEDEKEFCQKAFEQVKKDYGYGDLKLDMILDETTDGILGGGWHSSGSEFRIFYKNIIKHHNNVFDKKTKANILGVFFHEFQHVKQTEYCIRTDLEKYVRSIGADDVINKNYIVGIQGLLKSEEKIAEIASQKKMTPEQVRIQLQKELETIETKGYTAMPDYVSEVNKQLDAIRARMNELFGKYEKFKPGTKEYEMGEKYTKNYGEYIEAQKDSDNKEYSTQLIEKEAAHVEDMSKDIPKRLRSIWNIFS